MFGGKDYTKVPVNKRNFGFVFQSYALFPHLSVYDNVAFGLRMRKVKDKEIASRVMRILEVVNLNGFEKRFLRSCPADSVSVWRLPAHS